MYIVPIDLFARADLIDIRVITRSTRGQPKLINVLTNKTIIRVKISGLVIPGRQNSAKLSVVDKRPRTIKRMIHTKGKVNDSAH